MKKELLENGVGYCRRRFLAGYPIFKSWEAANELLGSCCQKDIEQGLHYKTKEKLADLFERTNEKLNPLPPKKKWCRFVDCRVDQCQLITIDNHQYSVPEKFVGCYMRAAVTIFKIEVFKDSEKITNHLRQYGNKDALQLDHYLDQLLKKPAAFSYAKVVAQNSFHPQLIEMKKRLLEKYGNKEATRQFVSILMLRRQCSQEDLLAGVKKALEWGAMDYAAVETIIRQHQVSEPIADNEKVQSFIPVKEMD